MDYASIVVTFNRKDILQQAINSLLNQTLTPKKIIVADNASTDGTDAMMEERFADNSQIKYVRLNENGGGSAGFYRGFQEALKEDVDWISVSDDDALYAKDFFEKIAQQTKRYPNIKAFSGSVYTNGNQLEKLHRRRVKNWNVITEEEVPQSDYKGNFKYDLFTFVGVVFNKKLIEKIGLPMKDYFIWYDDSEYSLRVRKYTEVLNVSAAKIYHKVNKPKQQGWKPNWREYYGMRNRIQTIKKHGHPYLLTRIYIYGMFIKKMIGNTVKSERKGYRKYMYHSFIDGFRDGMHDHLGKNDKYLPSVKIEKD